MPKQIFESIKVSKFHDKNSKRATQRHSETEIKLLNVARASLKELQADYEDNLRARKMTIWDENPAGKPTVKAKVSTPSAYPNCIKEFFHSIENCSKQAKMA